MKKTRKLFSIMTSMALFTCAAVVPMSSYAALVTDNTRTVIENEKEAKHVRIDFNYDRNYVEQSTKDFNNECDELAKQYIESLDKSQYGDAELLNIRAEYRRKIMEERKPEYLSNMRKELAASIIEDIGIQSESVIYPEHNGTFYCDLTAEQLENAEKNDKITMISLDSDYDEYGNYIGTPNPWIHTGTTTTAVSSTSNTSTTSVITTTTSAEQYGTEMFTDTIESIGRDMVKFKEHGAYYLGITHIEDIQKLMTYKQGNEVLIGIEYIRANDTHVSINKIFMLSASKLDLGDPNGDSKIDAKDASFTLGEYSKLSTGGASNLTSVEKSAADANKDSQIDSKDASLMLGMYAYNSTSNNKLETMEAYIEYLKSNT